MAAVLTDLRALMNRPARKKPMKPGHAGFCRGVIWALQVLYDYEGCITPTYQAVVTNSGRTDLLKIAKRDGRMRCSGLSEYVKAESK